MTPELDKKVNQAIRLLKLAEKSDNDLELCYSGGKDSDVILELARMAGIKFTAIYKATTIDPPYTIAHCRENGVHVVFPKKTFFQLVEEKGMPSRFWRWCCGYLKEYKIKETQILGIRKCESVKRASLYKEPIMCRVYKNNGGGGRTSQVLPLLDWSNEDVLEFIKQRNIKLHPLYYRADGSIDITRRLGCLACPLAADRGLADFKRYPHLVVAYIRTLKKWWNRQRKKPTKQQEFFSDVYEMFALKLFNNRFKDMTPNKESMFPIDYKQQLENYFKVKFD